MDSESAPPLRVQLREVRGHKTSSWVRTRVAIYKRELKVERQWVARYIRHRLHAHGLVCNREKRYSARLVGFSDKKTDRRLQ